MVRRIHLDMKQQPDDYTCGPTCLHAVYNYFNDPIPLEDVISQVERLEDGGTLGVMLANHALQRSYKAVIYTYNLRIFDPTWFDLPDGFIEIKLQHMLNGMDQGSKLAFAIRHYLKFLQLGGEIRFKDLNANLLRYYLKREIPILTGLSSTYLYRCARERDAGDNMVYDDIFGLPTGHFVVLSGYRLNNRTVKVADPYSSNPKYSKHYYDVKVDRLINSILLGILTYDANLLILEPTTPTQK
jgi:hypothetical protein